MKTKKTIMLISIFSFIATANSFALNNEKIWPIEDSVYDYLDYLFIESGYALPFQSKPYSSAELKLYLNMVDYNSLSSTGKQCYDHITTALRPSPLYKYKESFQFDSKMIINIESYLHTNAKVRWDHDYKQRLAAIEIPFELALFDNIYSTFTISAKENYGMSDNKIENYLNWPSLKNNYAEIDWNWPFRALLSIGNPHWNLLFGRDKLSWGAGHSGNLHISDYSDYFDMVKLTTYWSIFKFTALYFEMDPYDTNRELPIDVDPYHAYFGRQIEVKLFNRINLTVAESGIFGTQYPEIRNFNPLMLIHNMRVPERMNYMATADIDFTILNNMNVYAQMAFDELETNLDGELPQAIGFIGGFRTVFPLWKGYLSGVIEFVHTDTWLYNYYHYLTKYLNRRQTWTNYPKGQTTQDQPIGYYLGPDSENIYFELNYNIPDLTKIEFQLSLISKGIITLEDDYDINNKNIAPTGIVEYKTMVKIGNYWTINKQFEIGGNIYFSNYDNYNHVSNQSQFDLQLSFFCQLKIDNTLF